MAKPKLSLIIPAHNEEGSIKKTVMTFHKALANNGIPHELVVIDDHSSDRTAEVIKQIRETVKEVKSYPNTLPNGFGFAIRTGLDKFTGQYAAIVMADLSDNPRDLVAMYNKALEGYDSVFGTRFHHLAKVSDYPLPKLILNRLTNNIIRLLFMIPYNDVTNAFKLYSRTTINGLQPFLSNHFNLTVELPLKTIVRGYTYAVVPTDWTNRKSGVSKLKIKEMGSRYFFIILYCWLEKLLSRGDYSKK
jgi:dolichol-phosphate mannosyltransferase